MATEQTATKATQERLQTLKEINAWTPQCLEYMDTYWSVGTSRNQNQHLHNTCYKGMQEMFLALLTSKFNDTEKEVYQERILKKLGYVLGTPESKKVRHYIKDVAMNNRLASHVVFLSCNLLHNSTVSVIAKSTNSNVNILKDVWIQQSLMKESKYHSKHYYQIRARNKKLMSVLTLCTATNFQKEGLILKKEGTENYLNRNLDAVIQGLQISLEAMVILGYIVKVMTTTFKMNMVTSEKYLSAFTTAVVQNRTNYITEEKNYLMHSVTTINGPEKSYMELHVPIYNILYGCLQMVVNSDFVQEEKSKKLKSHKS